MPRKFTVSIDAPDKLIARNRPDLKPLDAAQLRQLASGFLDNHSEKKLGMKSGGQRKTWGDQQLAGAGLKALLTKQLADHKALFEKYEKLEAQMQAQMGFEINTALKKVVDKYVQNGDKGTEALKKELAAQEAASQKNLQAYIGKLKA